MEHILKENFISQEKGNKMALFAIINNDKVSNVIIAETKEIAELVSNGIAVEYQPDDYVFIGMEFKDGEFILPPPPIEPDLPKVPASLQ
jgi:hypothetical protein